MVFSNVPSAKQREVEDLQVEPLSKMKKTHGRKDEFRRCILGLKHMELIQKLMEIQRFPFLHFMQNFGELQNIMLFKESEQVIITRKIVQQMHKL